MSFFIASSPHTHQRRTTQDVMRWVLLALLPGLMAQFYFFGWGVLFQILVAAGVALATEALILVLRDKPVRATLNDYSALVTAVLLAISIPPLAPWWVIVVGTVFAIAIVKHVYGGVGQNVFNPAMAAYVLLLISFPVQMTSWLPPSTIATFELSFIDSLWLFLTQFTTEGYSLEQARLVELTRSLDAIVMATPLDHMKTQLGQGFALHEITHPPLFIGMAGSGWQWVNFGYLIGGLILLQQRIIQWHIPVALLAALAGFAAIGSILSPDVLPGVNLHLLSGGTMLAAFFIATDPVSAATSNRGKLLYAALIGALIYIIRTWGGYPDAIAFAVLLANLCVPVIDYYTRPTAYGHGSKPT